MWFSVCFHLCCVLLSCFILHDARHDLPDVRHALEHMRLDLHARRARLLGCAQRVVEQDFAVADHYAVLFNPDRVKPFLTAVKKINQLRSVFIVTDDDTLFQRVSALVPDEVDGHRVDVVRLYENYLTNFKNNAGWM